MTLPNEHLPLPCSLRDLVNSNFPHEEPGADATVLDTDALAARVRAACEEGETPLKVLRRQGNESDGGLPAAADASTIEWVTLAFEGWERDYPLEGSMREALRRLLPLAAAVALRDEHFFQPGEHPLHRLLDQLQASATGWQERLDRAGQMLEQRVQRGVEQALKWLEDPETDFAAVAEELAAATERDEERAARMVRRLEETEEAAARMRLARREAGRLLNQGLASYPLPAAIAEFIKGAWYDSLQLVALRHGTSSSEWREAGRITDQLMASVQPAEGNTADRSSEALRKLSADLRQWLLSLEHDSAAADDAIGLVEYVHLRMSHGQDLGLATARPIDIPGEKNDDEDGAEETRALETGQWFLLRDEEGDLRACLSLQLEEGHHLLFTNAVGLKAMDLGRSQFIDDLRSGAARHLATADTFSLSLAHAAGINDEHKLRALVDPNYVPPAETEAAPGEEDVAAAPEPDPDDRGDAGDSDREENALAAAASNADVAAATATRQAYQTQPSMELELVNSDNNSSGDSPGSGGGDGEQPPGGGGRRRRLPPGPELDVPMGAWLGFHDGETPIMAKLVVFDPRREHYIFVNRRGIALREISRSELLELIDDGLVDILETRSYFRDEVQRAREQRDE
ncbi:MAG TPA: hypothetical protein DD491_16950 [Halieaceae bacterium]|nr:hypothetical protein [Halieaceae bacterium]